MDPKRALNSTATIFKESIVPKLSEYIRIPNKSPLFDAEWQAHGHMDRAAELMAAWCREQPIAGLKVEIVREPGRTPVLFCEIPGKGDDTVLLYGHMDKQPEFTGWAAGPVAVGTGDSATENCTAAVAPTTAMRCSPR